ncbi:uncharacterized protein LOC135503238 isoform X2 [Lineus longissimus]|uniref:uncharacterized protein LOC135503238 isoform X2 n=1 Tax=Lineus longissimus TaxID=88925 RepID=UPI002B4E7746
MTTAFDAKKFLDWFVAFRDPREIWEKHPTFLLGECMFYLLALLTLVHALRHGGRFAYLWLAVVMHGLTVEMVSYWVPDIDNFWHAQTMIMFLGKRLPLYVVCAYPVFIYTASVAVSKLRLPSWSEPFAVGLSVVLLDVPFDIIGIKHLWWTWHDTDPNIFDRHYWVPWTSYYFHASFACSFTILFHGTRWLLTKREKFEASSFPVEMTCNIITGVFSMPMGVLQFLPLYHPLHDMLKLHTEVCVLLLIGIYIVMVWSGDRSPDSSARTNRGNWLDEIGWVVFLHYSFYILLVSFGMPEKIQSVGLHEMTGPCGETESVRTAFGQVLSKKKYLCTENYDEGYFDFKCLKAPPANGLDWYTICGNSYPNYEEYVIVVMAFCCLGFFVYWQMLANSGNFPKIGHPAKTHYHHKKE